jgi:hypothetical protein
MSAKVGLQERKESNITYESLLHDIKLEAIDIHRKIAEVENNIMIHIQLRHTIISTLRSLDSRTRMSAADVRPAGWCDSFNDEPSSSEPSSSPSEDDEDVEIMRELIINNQMYNHDKEYNNIVEHDDCDTPTSEPPTDSDEEQIRIGDWLQMFDSEGNAYWCNEITGEATWDDMMI